VDVYPAVSVAGEGGTLEVSFNSADFKFPPTSKKFAMIVCATQLI